MGENGRTEHRIPWNCISIYYCAGTTHNKTVTEQSIGIPVRTRVLGLALASIGIGNDNGNGIGTGTADIRIGTASIGVGIGVELGRHCVGKTVHAQHPAIFTITTNSRLHSQSVRLFYASITQ